MNKKIVAAMIVVCGACATVLARDSRAGQGSSTSYASCFKDPTTGAGWCIGTFDGFLNSSDANAGAYFTSNTTAASGSWSFNAELYGYYYSCSAPTAGSQLAAMTPEVLTADMFIINWDASGQCTSLRLARGSAYHSSW